MAISDKVGAGATGALAGARAGGVLGGLAGPTGVLAGQVVGGALGGLGGIMGVGTNEAEELRQRRIEELQRKVDAGEGLSDEEFSTLAAMRIDPLRAQNRQAERQTQARAGSQDIGAGSFFKADLEREASQTQAMGEQMAQLQIADETARLRNISELERLTNANQADQEQRRANAFSSVMDAIVGFESMESARAEEDISSQLLTNQAQQRLDDLGVDLSDPSTQEAMGYLERFDLSNGNGLTGADFFEQRRRDLYGGNF